MKKALRIFAVICLTLAVVSCSKDDDPADNDLFVGTYEGRVSYSDGRTEIYTDESSVTVLKTCSNYNFNFNKSCITMLTGVKFKEDGDKTLVNVDFEEGLHEVRITASSLNILYSKDGQTWTANCTR